MIYLVLSALCLALLYGVYQLALSRTTLHRFNRIMLLSIIGLSAILPSFKIKGIHFDFKKDQTVLVEKDNTPLEAQTEVVPIISEPIDYVLITQEEPKADVKTSVATLLMQQKHHCLILTEVICHGREYVLTHGS